VHERSFTRGAACCDPPNLCRPCLFQLRLRFVHKERIGIDEINAEQILTFRLYANEARSPQVHDRNVSSDIGSSGRDDDAIARRFVLTRFDTNPSRNSNTRDLFCI
jgi:hypothetical protein